MTDKGRPPKETADYFPHYTHHGKTIAILESRHGNDGYAVWFKTLEILGSREGHFIDADKPDEWEFLLTVYRVEDDTALAILDLLARVGAIDGELWHKRRVIYSDNFVRNLAPMYSRRTSCIPKRPEHLLSVDRKADHSHLMNETNGKVKYRKEEESKEDEKTSAGSELPAVAVAPFVRLPLNTGEMYDVDRSYVDKLKTIYPAVDVEQQLRSMLAWCDANPSNRKTAGGIKRFIVNWLNKEQNKARVVDHPSGSGNRVLRNLMTGEPG